jgi:hypothetical protein
VLSAVALVIAVLGATPLGQAAGGALSKVPPFARKAGSAGQANHAKRADLANNSLAVNGFKASRLPQAGKLLVLGSNGKFPEAVGAVGPAGPAGPQGPAGQAGPAGVVGLQVVSGTTPTDSSTEKNVTTTCPTGKKALGGGAQLTTGSGSSPALRASAQTTNDDGWFAAAGETAPYSGTWSLKVFAICATVSS